MATDNELMYRIAGKDQNALENIYERYGFRLYSLALRITGDSGSAEEILQDTFFQLWLKASDFDATRGSLIGWLLTMIRYRAISRVRAKTVRPRNESLSCNDAAQRPSTESPHLEQHITRELISTALASLSVDQREAINLAYFDGLTCEEISLRTKAPLGTTKSRLRSAHHEMKKALSNQAQRSATLEDILITDQLFSRPQRHRFPEQEKKSLQVLTQAVDSSPERLIEAFLQLALDLCCSGTAGLSFLEDHAKGAEVFRWTHLAGTLKKYVGGTTPRNFSPCGVTLDRDSPQLFDRPGRYFNYFNDVDVPIVEGLVIPFRIGAITEGTLWIVSHDEGTVFDSEDARIMTVLTEFAGCALHVSRSMTKTAECP